MRLGRYGGSKVTRI